VDCESETSTSVSADDQGGNPPALKKFKFLANELNTITIDRASTSGKGMLRLSRDSQYGTLQESNNQQQLPSGQPKGLLTSC